MSILKRLTPNGELLIPGEFDEQTGIIPGSINFASGFYATGSSGKLNVTHANTMNFGTGNFTIEFWFNMRTYFSGYYYSGGQTRFFRELTFFKNDNLTIKLIPNINVNGGDFAYFSYITNAGITSWRLPNWSLSDGTYIDKPDLWHHYSLVRYNSAIEMYYDGTKVIQTLGDSRTGSMGQNNEDITLAGSILQIGDITYNGEVTPDPTLISYSPRGGIPGKVTGVRWAKEALHTGNFIPSKSYPTTSANTSLLLAPTGNKNDVSNNLILDISGTNKVIVAEQPTGNFNSGFITDTIFSSWSPYVSTQSRVTQDFLYAISFDEVSIHPITSGLAMRETANSIMVAGEFDEVTKV